MGRLELFVIGELSGNPGEWSDRGPRIIVLAHDGEEALLFADHSSMATEVILTPGVLMTTEGMSIAH